MKASLWARYITELLGGERIFIERDFGFISYSLPKLPNDVLWLHDIYVVPDQRGEGRGRELFETACEVGRKAGRTYILTQIEIGTKIYTESLKAHLQVGLVPIAAEGGKIILKGDL